MIRLGLIGCGAHSESGHAIPLARYKAAHSDEILLAAVCGLQIERALEFGRKYGFLKAYQDVDDMLQQENLDGCIAVVPPENISDLGIKLLNLGIPCVVEKPLRASLAEAQALRDAAAATKTSNMVSVNRRFMPLLNRAIEWTRHCAEQWHDDYRISRNIARLTSGLPAGAGQRSPEPIKSKSADDNS